MTKMTLDLFTVNLDSDSGVFMGKARWLGIVAKCSGDGAYVDMGRQELAASPYALYTLSGTAGQPDGAIWSGGTYTLAGGFWAGAAVGRRVYLPLVLR